MLCLSESDMLACLVLDYCSFIQQKTHTRATHFSVQSLYTDYLLTSSNYSCFWQDALKFDEGIEACCNVADFLSLILLHLPCQDGQEVHLVINLSTVLYSQRSDQNASIRQKCHAESILCSPVNHIQNSLQRENLNQPTDTVYLQVWPILCITPTPFSFT